MEVVQQPAVEPVGGQCPLNSGDIQGHELSIKAKASGLRPKAARRSHRGRLAKAGLVQESQEPNQGSGIAAENDDDVGY